MGNPLSIHAAVDMFVSIHCLLMRISSNVVLFGFSPIWRPPSSAHSLLSSLGVARIPLSSFLEKLQHCSILVTSSYFLPFHSIWLVCPLLYCFIVRRQRNCIVNALPTIYQNNIAYDISFQIFRHNVPQYCRLSLRHFINAYWNIRICPESLPSLFD